MQNMYETKDIEATHGYTLLLEPKDCFLNPKKLFEIAEYPVFNAYKTRPWEVVMYLKHREDNYFSKHTKLLLRPYPDAWCLEEIFEYPWLLKEPSVSDLQDLIGPTIVRGEIRARLRRNDKFDKVFADYLIGKK